MNRWEFFNEEIATNLTMKQAFTYFLPTNSNEYKKTEITYIDGTFSSTIINKEIAVKVAEEGLLTITDAFTLNDKSSQEIMDKQDYKLYTFKTSKIVQFTIKSLSPLGGMWLTRPPLISNYIGKVSGNEMKLIEITESIYLPNTYKLDATSIDAAIAAGLEDVYTKK